MLITGTASLPSLTMDESADKVSVPGEPVENSQNGNQGAKTRKETVAIIGSGMAGLATAHLLSIAKDEKGRTRFDVEVLEMQDGLSLDSASYTLPVAESVTENGRLNPRPSSKLSSVSTLVSSSGEKHGTEKDSANGDIGEERAQGPRVDLPMRAFAAGYYDNLRQMYTYLGVRFAEPRFVYSLSRLPSSGLKDGNAIGKREGGSWSGAYFIHSSNNHILPPIRPPGVGLLAYVVEIAYLLFWYAWFTTACFFIPPLTLSTSSPKPTKASTGTGETLSSYLTRTFIPSYYIQTYFLPLMSSITTCTHEELLSFPASDIIGYAVQTFRKPHYTVTGGVKEAEGRLASQLKVRFRTRVENVQSLEGGRVRVSWTEMKKAQGEKQEQEVFERGEKEYDRVIIAVTPDVLGKIFPPLSKQMQAIPTTYVSTIVHTDFDRVRGVSTSIKNEKRLRKRNIKTFLDTPSSSNPTFHAVPLDTTPPLTAMHMLTHTSRSGTRTESIHEHPANVLVSTYAMDGISEEKILHSVRFTRVLRTSRSRDVVNEIFERSAHNSFSKVSGEKRKSLCRENESEKERVSQGWKNGDGHVYIVGGWCWDGMVLLEGCIISAMRVAKMVEVDVPWAGIS
ncbi:hypothetical protein BDV06DRAFT_203710 [Aspergillus oleicola]